MAPLDLSNKGAAGIPYYTPAQEPAAGTAENPETAPTLFKPVRTGPVELHNRIVVSPMCMYSADNGHLTDFHLVHLGQFALRGAGLVIVEATAVEPRGRISPQDSGLWQDSQIEPLRRIVDFVHSQGSKAGIQIAHAGRKASTLAPWIGGTVKKTLADASVGGWPDDVVGPSAIPWDDTHAAPKELSVAEIKETIQKFADTAIRAVKAGFDVLEIHGAHGYLITSFLSPVSNQRTDEYGGSFENRIRFLTETIQAVRAVIPREVALWVRLSATEWLEHKGQPSWDVESSVRLAKLLPSLGVDALDISSGGNHPDQKIVMTTPIHAKFSRQVRQALRADGLDLPIALVGGITDAEVARSVLDQDGNRRSAETIQVATEHGQVAEADLVLVGRQFLREPEWVLRVAHELQVPVKWPNQYHRAPNKPHSKF